MGLTTQHRKAYLHQHMTTSLRSVLGDGWQKWGLPGFDDQGMQLEVRRKDGPVLPCVRREELAQKRGYGRRSIKLLKTGGQEHSESYLLHDLHNLINLCLRIRESRKNIPAMRNIKIFPGSLSERRIRKEIPKPFTKNLFVSQPGISVEIIFGSIQQVW